MLDAEAEASSPSAWLASSWPIFVSREIGQRVDLHERHARIADLVSQRIVPRLLLDHRPDHDHRLDEEPTAQDVRSMAQLVLGADITAASEHLLEHRSRGLTPDALFLGLLEPAARLLGEMWERDECDFVDVTIGVGRLQGLLTAFGDLPLLGQLQERRTVLLAVTPGDQHFFGLAMVERFLISGGWNVQVEADTTIDGLAASVGERWYAGAGLSSGSEVHLDVLAEAIAAIRRSSRNRAIGIMVGGPSFGADPDLATRLGADATAVNGPAAVVAAQRLFDAGAGSARV